MLILLLAALATFEASYVDASGASCVAFGAGQHEVDFCHGRFSR